MLWDSDEVIWYSQRSDWGNLYLYDLQSGELKNAITSGEGPVTKIVHVDKEARQLWYTANGREAGQDPYFAHGYRVSLDGGDAVSLTPENGTHTIGLSPSCGYLVDTFSRPEVAPVTVLRDVTDGAVLMTLEVIARNISELWACVALMASGMFVRTGGGHLGARGGRLEASHTDHGQGGRRRDGSLRTCRIALSATTARTASQQHLPAVLRA